MNVIAVKAHIKAMNMCRRMRTTLEEGQGTTEYAILVGVLAVIAMIAIVAFKGKIQTLWNAISEGVNAL